MDTIDIYVATHKKMNYRLPSIYKLCQVNAAINGKWPQYIHDDDNEDNISRKNYCYCELTAHYDLWKNNQSEIKGLAHYRRFFSNIDIPSFSQFENNQVDGNNISSSLINDKQIRGYLHDYDIILQWPVNPYHTNAYENLTKYVFPKDIEILISVIESDFPEYRECLKGVFSRIGISYLNMLIAKREVFDQYSGWLFDVLGRIERKIDISDYDVQHKRIYGYLSELLLNVYVDFHKLKVKYVNMTELLEIPDHLSWTEKIKKEYCPEAVKSLWMGIRTDAYKKHRYIKYIAAGNIPDWTLDDYYTDCKSFSDVYRMMKKYRELDTSIKEFTIDNSSISYIESISQGTSNQGSNGAICIVNIILKSDKYADTVVSKLYDKYSDKYILNIRIFSGEGAGLNDVRDKSGKRCYMVNLHNSAETRESVVQNYAI